MKVLFVTVQNVDVPEVRAAERSEITELAPGIHRVLIRYGFMESPDVPRDLALALRQGETKLEPMRTSYFIGRSTLRPSKLTPLIFTLSVVAIIYTSLVAFVQEDMKKLVAYSSVAHMGFVTIGIFTGVMQGVHGALFQMLSHGIVSAALFLIVVIYKMVPQGFIPRQDTGVIFSNLRAPEGIPFAELERRVKAVVCTGFGPIERLELKDVPPPAMQPGCVYLQHVDALPRDMQQRLVDFLHPGPDTPDDLRALLAQAEQRDLIGADSREMLEGVLGQALEAGLIIDAAVSRSLAQFKSLWALRDNISEAQAKEGPNVKHDVSIPISRMADYIAATDQELARAYPAARVVTFGHVGDGNVHYNVSAPEGVDAAGFIREESESINRLVHDSVNRFGGSISAEHGLGQYKREEITRYKSPVEMRLMRAVKYAIDPRGLMNPGKVL